MRTLVIGDSYSKPRVAPASGMGLDDGDPTKAWTMLLGLPVNNCRGVSGSTAAEWAGDYEGWLTEAQAVPSDVLIVSLLGNDAFTIESEDANNPTMALEAASVAYSDFSLVLAAMKRKTTYVILYPDPFAGKRADFNMGLPVLNSAIRLIASTFDGTTLVDLQTILSPSNFNGVDIHPMASGHKKIADYFSRLIL